MKHYEITFKISVMINFLSHYDVEELQVFWIYGIMHGAK